MRSLRPQVRLLDRSEYIQEGRAWLRSSIVGGGAMGSSIAWHLAGDPNFDGTVTVIERDPTYTRASSALSASSIRQQFSTPLNIHLSRYGIGFLRQAKELLDVDLGLREPGYLFLASPAGEAVLRANNAIQRGEGCAVELLDPAALAGRFPGDLGGGRGARLARHGQRGMVRWAGADAGLSAQGAGAGRRIRRRRGGRAGAARGHAALRPHDRGQDHRHRRRPVVGRGRGHGGYRAAGRAAPPLGLRLRLPREVAAAAAHHRSVGRLVPAGGPLLSRRHDAGAGQRSGRARRSRSSTRNGTTWSGRRWPIACRPSRRPRW